MERVTHYPFLVFVLAFVFLSIASIAGASLCGRYPTVSLDHKEDLGVILAATLTLLALIIGFSFAMATNRYDERKRIEQGRPTRPAPKYCEPNYCSQQRPRNYASCWKNILISASCFMISRTFHNRPSALANWRPISGTPYAKLRRRSQRPLSPLCSLT